MDVKDDDGRGTAPGQGDVGQDAGQGDRGRDVALGLHPLRRARGEVWEDQGERADKHAGQLVDDGELLEDGGGRLEGGEEGDVAVADAGGVLDEQVGEAVGKGAVEGEGGEGVGAAERAGLREGAAARPPRPRPSPSLLSRPSPLYLHLISPSSTRPPPATAILRARASVS